MTKKSQKKPQKQQQPAANGQNVKKLPVLKRIELNQLIDSLLKLGFNPTANVTEQWNQYVEMQTLLARVLVIENELKVKTVGGRNRAACIDNFTEWARQNGAQFDGVKIAEFPNYELGLAATKDFKKDEMVTVIPRKMIMSLDNVSAAIAPMMSQLPIIEYMLNVKLAFSLLVEKLNPNSFWKPYIDVLPEKYTTVMNFSVSDMQELKGSAALPAALSQCKNIVRQYAFIHKFIQNITDSDPILDLLKDKFTYELYCWAVSTVMSRQNPIPRIATLESTGDSPEEPSDVPQSSPALIPLWDFANHIDGVVTSSFNAEKNQCESTALLDFKKNEQIFIFYGVRNNTNLMVHNGFVYPENSSDSISIRLGVSTLDPLLKQRTELLTALNLTTNCELDVLPAPNYISPKLLAFVRIFNMNEEHLTHWLKNVERVSDLLHLDCALDTALESKSWIFLKMRLTLLLKLFPTTLAQDETLIETHRKGQNKLGHIKAMVITFRITEKRILSDALDYVQQRTKP